MPEGVEVKIATEYVRSKVKGKRVHDVFIGGTSRYKKVYPIGFEHFVIALPLLNVRVVDVECKGKFQYWTFSNGYYMLTTFGMSGQWYPEEKKHTCIQFDFGDIPFDPPECSLYFNDPRHFGTIKFIRNIQDINDKLNDLGWDPFQNQFATYREQLLAKFKNNNKTVAQLLMDQSVFAGVGNYIKCESLYQSNLSPWRPGKSLSEPEISFLCQAIDNVMHKSYDCGGSTIATYQTPNGKRGNYANFFKVYDQKFDPHGNVVIKETTPDKRSTYWCPKVQK